MSNRTRGDYFERRTRAILQLRGWLVVRSAGSLGACDLVAIKADHLPLLIACKLNGRMDPGEWNALYDTALEHGAIPVLAWREGNHGARMAVMRAPKINGLRASNATRLEGLEP